MLRNCSEDALFVTKPYVIALLEASSVRRHKLVDNHSDNFGRAIYHVEKEELQRLCDTIP